MVRASTSHRSTMKVPVLVCPSNTTTTPGPRLHRIRSAPPNPSSSVGTSQLAQRLQQNWLAQHPTDTCSNGGVSLDDSLTSLTWLQNLNILKITSPTPPASPPLSHLSAGQQKLMKSSSTPPLFQSQTGVGSGVLATKPSRLEAQMPLADTPPLCGGSWGGSEAVDYRENPYVKPPFSYATLICMAMKETRKHKISLSSIYEWITENFMYYRMAEPSWQNSIRHNLSLNKCFEKVPRRKDEPGKGGFWRINPEYSDMMENGTFKKRRNSRDSSCPVPPAKRVKQEEDELLMAVNSIKGTREDKLLSNGSVHYDQDDTDDSSMGLQSNFNWSAILNQDIDIGGVTVKTEQIIDNEDSGPLIAMSPPSSDSNSDDLGLDELFSQTDISMDVPLDCTTHSRLDLTITGTGIQPPDWWGDSLLQDIKTEPDDSDRSSGLHTPVHPSSRSEADDLWASATGMDAHGPFDLDNLFDIENIPSPKML
ncbi:LOW QUALITY PROTEIN: forkhead box protein J1-like [Babylonia areolata]|uniref:LOW QUALITY PROTEIN: forkhead box protein J1-like n=1 Tax=Babylonia areolata TaxID=304850 RepID=UPI003FD1917B